MMKRILTTFALVSALLLTVAAQEKKLETGMQKTTAPENNPAPGTLMLNKDFSPTALEAGEQLYYPVLLHCDTARKRLYVSQCLTRIDFHNQHQKRRLTRFMLPIQKYFG